MKQFNREIQVTVSVDAVAQRMLAIIPETVIGREQIVEAAIGVALHSEVGIAPIYNALCGFNNQLNVKIGDKVLLKEQHTVWVKGEYRPITSGTIVEIDEYRRTQVRISTIIYVDDNPEKEVTEWTNIGNITLFDALPNDHLPLV